MPKTSILFLCKILRWFAISFGNGASAFFSKSKESIEKMSYFGVGVGVEVLFKVLFQFAKYKTNK